MFFLPVEVRKATIQSAALLDLAGGSEAVVQVEEGRELLHRVVAMLTGLSRVATND